MSWRTDTLPDLVRSIASRPKHEALRLLVGDLLRHGFGVPFDELSHEVYLLDGRGRIDTLWGATVIELKSHLGREEADVLARMPDYLRDAEARHPRRRDTGIGLPDHADPPVAFRRSLRRHRSRLPRRRRLRQRTRLALSLRLAGPAGRAPRRRLCLPPRT